ncbi:MAG: LLM class flavin-dependent oxidoreductase [Candidatus Binataceae bacterium]|jgi:alkanesulfonate monooxygenase SsuD/methylene tetrahydromethanopterin reductase-like flavin-dependent oxidoreductase (luciferase family)
MILMYFTERPYRDVPEDEVIKNRAFFGVPNRFFDREVGSRLYNEYLDEMVYAEDVGFDAIMLNEHHGTPFCMGAVMNVEASILARITKRVRIVLLGNPLPTFMNPLRIAEELATIDCISHGRLVPGWVRGAGSEQIFNEANPAYNRERFEEAHDLIMAAWMRPGPFRWEGKHFNYRYVNPWVTPYQKPHPPIMIPGVLSPETVVWCAKHRYPYLGLGTALSATAELWNIYGDTAAQEGYVAGSENFGYLQHVFVAETEEKAQELGKAHLFGGGQGAFSRPEHTLPPGYNSKEATKRLARTMTAGSGGFLGVSAEQLGRSKATEEPANLQAVADSTRRRLARGEATIEEAKAAIYKSYQKAQDGLQIITGTPKSVIPKIRKILEVLRPGTFGIFQSQGPVSLQDRMTSIRLLGQEVLPAVREIGKELGIQDPFELQPGSRPYTTGAKRDQLVSLEALRANA